MPSSEDRVTRRGFLRGVVVLVSGGTVVSVIGCAPMRDEAAVAEPLGGGLPTQLQYEAVMPIPTARPEPGRLAFFSVQEALTVEAITARLLPGTPDDPGAREAGVVFYIDYLLAYADGFAEATYRQAPYAALSGQGGGEESPPTPTAPPADAAAVEERTPTPPPALAELQVIWVPEDLIERYGYQSTLTPRDVYRAGVAAVDRYSRERFARPFVELSEGEQDQIIAAMLDGSATGFEPLTPQQFFHTLRRHTAEGMFSDPIYGGNRDMVGWLLIGYPGAQRAYTEEEIRNPNFARAPQDLAALHAFHPGQDAHPGAVLPLSGSDPSTWHETHEEHNTPSEPLRP